MKELENKIREALPRLKELTDGAIIYKPHFNVFSQKYEKDEFDETEYRFGKFFQDNVEQRYFKLDSDWSIGHPIKLNDVLEYINLNNKYQDISFNCGGVFIQIDRYSDNGIKTYNWNLSSVFLADQSEELKEFLNSL